MKVSSDVIKSFNLSYVRREMPWMRNKIPNQVRGIIVDASLKFKEPKLLDIGCGNGWISNFIASRGISVEAIDSSKVAITEAMVQAKSWRLDNIHYKVGDALELPYPDSSFDIVFDRGLFHHLPKYQWVRYMKGVQRVMKDDALFYLAVFSEKATVGGYSPQKTGRLWHMYKDRAGQYWSYDRFFNSVELIKAFSSKFVILGSIEEKRSSKHGTILIWSVMMKNGKKHNRG